MSNEWHKNKKPLPIHNLYELALKAKMTLPNQFEEYLNTISTFNLEARYDDYKLSFYKKATTEYTKLWFERSKEVQKWQKQFL